MSGAGRGPADGWRNGGGGESRELPRESKERRKKKKRSSLLLRGFSFSPVFCFPVFLESNRKTKTETRNLAFSLFSLSER